MLKSMISILFIICTAVASVAVADTNVAAKVERRQQAVVANVGVVSSTGEATIDKAIRAGLKEAARDAKVEYKDRYKDLKDAHDRFVSQLSNSLWVISALVTLLGVVVPIVGMIFERRGTKAVVEREILKYHNAMEDVRKTSMELKKAQAKSSLNMMKFVWVEFLHVITAGGYDKRDHGRDIAQPIYRMVEALTFANQLGDEKFLKMCVRDVVQVIDRYRDVLNGKDDLEEKFKAFMKEHRICTESADFYDLAQTMAGNNTSLEKVLKFLNEFGITMFGEVGG